MKKLLFAILCFLFVEKTWAQKSIVFQFQQPQWFQIKKSLQDYGISPILISHNLQLAQINIQSDENTKELITKMQSISGILRIDLPGKVINRNTPNDPELARQTYLNQTQIDRIWDFTVGGKTRNNEEIVIAYIDEGVDSSNVDIKPNLWVNKNEIPNNKIDDDGNGFVDDVNGWNTGDTNNSIEMKVGSNHGTPIAGIIGAKGNNQIGVAGISWNVRVMPIVFWPTNTSADPLSSVYRSLEYVLKQKKIYLFSAGAKGANILACNISFGLEFDAFPENFPIFCNLIDSLYHYGILISIATTNSNKDIDNRGAGGDIPALCPSEGSIVVSNVDNNNQRVNSGFSKSNVDLSAPGTNIYNIVYTNIAEAGAYGTVSGTSYAAPQISGLVGLMNGYACIQYQQLLKNQPDSAVRLMKRWILRGVDKYNNLNSFSQTGGRLNGWRAFLQMDSWCKKNDLTYQTPQVEKKSINIFPNPANQYQKIAIENLPKQEVLIEFFSANGKLLLKPILVKNGKAEIYSEEGLPRGIYFLKLTGPNWTHSEKILITENE